MSNTKIYQLGRNAELREITEASILRAATEISGEDPADKGVNEALKRHILATQVINNSQQKAIIFAKAVAAQSGFYTVVDINADGSLNYTGGESLDSDLDFTIRSIWNDVAGVSYTDEQPT